MNLNLSPIIILFLFFVFTQNLVHFLNSPPTLRRPRKMSTVKSGFEGFRWDRIYFRWWFFFLFLYQNLISAHFFSLNFNHHHLYGVSIWDVLEHDSWQLPVRIALSNVWRFPIQLCPCSAIQQQKLGKLLTVSLYLAFP